jgi:glycosyltransferase involved in cell wall biosynthesis
VPRVLYISYDGLMEPLGQSQVLQYLKKLAAEHEIALVTYEKKEDWRDERRRESLMREVREAGIRWHPLRYHRRPSLPATAYDVSVGLAVCTYLALRYRVQIVHARSYVAAVIALSLRRRLGTRFVFDMRGFWADERVDAGNWSADSRVYKAGKAYERRFLTGADVVVSLTRAGVRIMRDFPYMTGRPARFEVIPTCTNLELFHPPAAGSAARPAQSPFTVGYVGTVSGWYVFPPALVAFNRIRQIRPDARLLIINRGQHAYIREQLAQHAIPTSCVEIREAGHSEVAGEIRKMDVTVFFIKPVFSKQASAPTKLGEFLGCGVPCLTNAGVGDVEDVVEGERVGVLVREFTPEAVERGAEELMRMVNEATVRDRCVRAARKWFALEDGVSAYSRIYASLSRGGSNG